MGKSLSVLLAMSLWLGLSNQPSHTGVAEAQAYAVYLPIIIKSPTYEWTQHAHNAQRTSYNPLAVPAPWRWKWAWNGPNSSGGVSAGKFGLPRNSQPVTGGGRVYIAAGLNGVYALNSANGAVVWNRNPGGSINSTPAYDEATGALFVVSSNGTLYKLNAATGATLNQFAGSGSSTLPLPPAITSGRVFFSMGNFVYAVNPNTMAQIWAYDFGSAVHTPPAYSAGRNSVIVVGQNLFVHAIDNATGTQLWAMKPTPLTGGDPGNDTNLAESKYGWPVIAEGHGLVLIKYRLDWQTMWTWNPWPSSNTAMRTNLTNRPDQQALFALNLENGTTAFISNVGHGGFGDGGYMPMGPQPVVKNFPNGQEVAYVVMRGSPCIPATSCDGRWDARLGEMVLDNSTVAGYQAGYVRFMQNTFFPTDEQANLTVAGNHILGGHWMFGLAHEILDRSASRGSSSSNPITTSNLSHILTSASNCGFSASHYCGSTMIQDGDARALPRGFYIYYNAGTVYNQYWSGYAAWVVSLNQIYFVSTDGAVVALESGAPAVASGNILARLRPGAPAPTATRAQPPLEIIPFAQAHNYGGQTKIVEGTIRYVFNNGLAVYLGFQYPHQGVFKVRILKEHWPAFAAPPETVYRVGQTVRVTGQLEWYQGDPVIYVQTPEQIQVMTGE